MLGGWEKAGQFDASVRVGFVIGSVLDLASGQVGTGHLLGVAFATVMQRQASVYESMVYMRFSICAESVKNREMRDGIRKLEYEIASKAAKVRWEGAKVKGRGELWIYTRMATPEAKGEGQAGGRGGRVFNLAKTAWARAYCAWF